MSLQILSKLGKCKNEFRSRNIQRKAALPTPSVGLPRGLYPQNYNPARYSLISKTPVQVLCARCDLTPGYLDIRQHYYLPVTMPC